MSAQKGFVPIIIIVIVVVLAAFYFVSSGKFNPTSSVPKPTTQLTTQPTAGNSFTSSAKGVLQVSNPTSGQKITSPLTVTGFVYGNNGTLTIKLKQKESGQYVTEDKMVQISGKSDTINFVEAIQFGLPAQPQPGILEISYKDKSGKGLDDKVFVDVSFPSDLGSGL